MTAAIDLGTSTGLGFLVGLVAYLSMWALGILEPQRFPHRGAHVERPRTAEIDLVGRHHGGSVAADLHHHELATLTASVTTEYASALSDGHVDLVEEKRVQSAITKLRDAADSHLCAIGARQRGLKAVS